MDISATLMGQVFIVWFLIYMPTVIYYARRKSRNVPLTVFWGIILSTIPIFNFIFLGLLWNRPDLPSKPDKSVSAEPDLSAEPG